MKSIKVNWSSLETAFERNAPELHSFIDRETGDIVVVVDGRIEDEENQHRIAAEPERFVKIDPASSREQYRWMERFVASLADGQLREKLLQSIDGKGAFRRFKDVLLGYPDDRERWFNYRSSLLHHHINQWFKGKNLAPEPPPPWGEVNPPDDPSTEGFPGSPEEDGTSARMRRRAIDILENLPVIELRAAHAFLEFLRDRGISALSEQRVSFVERPEEEDGNGEDLSESAGQELTEAELDQAPVVG